MILNLLFAIGIYCCSSIKLAFSGCCLHVEIQIRTLKWANSFYYKVHSADALLFWCEVSEHWVGMGIGKSSSKVLESLNNLDLSTNS